MCSEICPGCLRSFEGSTKPIWDPRKEHAFSKKASYLHLLRGYQRPVLEFYFSSVCQGWDGQRGTYLWGFSSTEPTSLKWSDRHSYGLYGLFIATPCQIAHSRPPFSFLWTHWPSPASNLLDYSSMHPLTCCLCSISRSSSATSGKTLGRSKQS
jgi:hypothetical protein